jgi:cation-transporting P-type ATPase 13A2
MTAAAITAELYDQIQNMRRLREMAHFEEEVTVRRIDHENVCLLHQINSDDLVPGDIMIVTEGLTMPCDAILLEGECVVNEAMLTGESLPSIKAELPRSDIHKMERFSIENKKQVFIIVSYL